MHYIKVSVAVGAGAVSMAAGQCVPQWDGSFVPGPDNGVQALHVVDSAGGPVLYVGGKFENVAGQPLSLVASYGGGAWAGLGNGIPSQWNSHGFLGCCAHVRGFVSTNDPMSPGVFVAGEFIQIDSVPYESIGRFGGGGWSPLAGGMSLNGCVDCVIRVNSVVWFDGMLHAAGGFDTAGGVPALNVARWTGTAWEALGDGVGVPATVAPSWVEALAVYKENGVERLFAAGSFDIAGSVKTRCIVRWDGLGWSDVGGGVGYDPLGPVPVATSLVVYDDGKSSALYMGGQFDEVGGIKTRNLAKWDGVAWSGVGDVGPGPNDMVRVLAVFDDGRGDALYVGGQFAEAGGIAAANIARFDGGVWEPLGSGVNGEVHALAGMKENEEAQLYVGGFFGQAGGMSIANLARWTGCAVGGCYANCDGSTLEPVLNVADFGCFLSKFAAGDPEANCDGSTEPPVLNVADFGCFLSKFAAGCP